MKIRFEWPANPPEQQVTSYNLHIRRGGTPIAGSPVAVSGNSYEIDNPPAGVYSAQVSAVNVAGESGLSAPGSGPNPPTTPSAPTITTVP